MSCDKTRARLTAYLDGELTDDRGSAVRGHLRGCEACRKAASDEAALRDGLRSLPPIDPPASLWAGVQQRLAAAEVADSERPAWRRALARFVSAWPQLALGGAVVAAAIVLIVIRMQRDEAPSSGVSEPREMGPVVIAPHVERPAVTPAVPEPEAEDQRDVSEVLASAPARITDDYAKAARELVELARQARAGWTEDQRREFDARLAELEQQIAAAKDERSRRRGYRKLMRYAQRAALRDEVMLAAVGGTP